MPLLQELEKIIAAKAPEPREVLQEIRQVSR